jgi:peptidoglycan biosynthesis protein MviN/MurJ (putative lipid II flippase)
MRKKIINTLNNANVRSIIIISGLLFVSRFLGFVRNWLIYQRMDSLSSDLLLASTKIPETISSLLIMGTIISSMLPIATRIFHQNNQDSKKVSEYINFMILSIVGFVGLVTVAAFIFTPQLLRTSSSGISAIFDQNNLFESYVLATRILLLGPILFAFQALFGVFLHIKKQFFWYSWAGAIYNIGTIIGIYIGVKNGYIQTAIGMMLGAAITVILFLVDSMRAGYRPHVFRSLSEITKVFFQYKTDIFKTWQVFFPRIMLLNGAIFANLIINTVAQNRGQITAFDIGLSIQGVFFSIITSASTVFFPDLAKASQEISKNTFYLKLKTYSRYSVLLALGGSVLTIAFAPVVMWLFEFTGKGQNNSEYIVLIARVCTLGLVFQSLNEILGKYFYVQERVWQPVFISLASVLVQCLAVVALLWQGMDAGIAVSLGLGVSAAVTTVISLSIMNHEKHLAVVA